MADYRGIERGKIMSVSFNQVNYLGKTRIRAIWQPDFDWVYENNGNLYYEEPHWNQFGRCIYICPSRHLSLDSLKRLIKSDVHYKVDVARDSNDTVTDVSVSEAYPDEKLERPALHQI